MNNIISSPLVSIILCTYNAERFIQPTIRSVISQSYPNIEVLVLDNASEDKTVEILKVFCKKDKRMKIFESRKNLGAYKGLNYLLDRSKGKYVAIIDHDDIWAKDKLKKQISFLEKHREYVGCGGLPIFFLEKNNLFYLGKFKHNNKFVPHPSLVFRNKKRYRYDVSIKYKTDSYFMKEILCKRSKLFLFNEYFYISRIRADNQNLTIKMRKYENIKSFFKITRDKKATVLGLLFIIFPKTGDFFYKRFFLFG
ncbi:MAG: glycosyltransferase family A protein, partial [Candidatus Pacebacteria bacterium]|nr:glycosyltransferase family A protein [Candidatus Paceibacterota bacterium]